MQWNIITYIFGSLIWSRDIICLHILLHRKKFLCSKICKQIMSLFQMRDPNMYVIIFHCISLRYTSSSWNDSLADLEALDFWNESMISSRMGKSLLTSVTNEKVTPQECSTLLLQCLNTTWSLYVLFLLKVRHFAEYCLFG